MALGGLSKGAPLRRLLTEGRKLKRKEYEKELRKLQTDLCSLQDWVKATGERIIVIFEGRDAAGKEAPFVR